MNEKQLNRTQIIFELAKYCHPSWYQKILGCKTEHLRALLEYYKRPEIKPVRTSMILVMEIGVDLAKGEDESVVLKWPFGYKVADREPLKNKMRFSDMRPKK